MSLNLCASSLIFLFLLFFFFKQKTAYEMRISDWSSDVCSSDLVLEQETRYRRDNPRPVDTGQSQHKFFVAQRVHPAPAAPHPMRCGVHPHGALQRGASTSRAGA